MLSVTRTFLLSAFALAALAACQPKEEAKEASSTPAASAASAASAAPAASGESAPKVQARGTDMRKEDIGGDFTLTDGDGKPFSLSDLKGKVVILSFGYTHCPDVCPTRVADFQRHVETIGRSG